MTPRITEASVEDMDGEEWSAMVDKMQSDHDPTPGEASDRFAPVEEGDG